MRLRSGGADSYRWVVLGACVFALLLSAGARMSVGDFLPAWQASFGSDVTAVSLAPAVALLCYGLLQPLVARALDALGVRAVLTLGALVIALGLWLTSRATSPLMLALTYGVVVAAGYAAVAQLTAVVAVTEWFSSGRGLAIGFCNAGNSVGLMVLGPVALYLIRTTGWRSTEVALAALVAGLVAPAAWLLVRPRPGGQRAGARRAPPARLEDVARERVFWLLAVPFFICGYTTNGLVGPHFVEFMDLCGFHSDVVSASLVAMGGASAVGAVLAGVAADRWGRARLLACLFAGRGLALLLMLLTRNPSLMILLSGYYGLLDFATVPPTASLAADFFGRRGTGTAYAWITLAHQMGGATSSLVAGVLVDAAGSFTPVYGLAAALLALAATLSWSLNRSEGKVRLAAAAD